MDPVTVIVSAVALGATAGLKDTAAAAVKDAYAGLKRLLSLHRVDVSGVERKPGSPTQRAALQESITETRADADVELLTAAQRLMESVREHDSASAAAIGIDLEGVISAGALRIHDVKSSGAGVRARDVKLGGDIEISGIRAGTVDADRP